MFCYYLKKSLNPTFIYSFIMLNVNQCKLNKFVIIIFMFQNQFSCFCFSFNPLMGFIWLHIFIGVIFFSQLLRLLKIALTWCYWYKITWKNRNSPEGINMSDWLKSENFHTNFQFWAISFSRKFNNFRFSSWLLLEVVTEHDVTCIFDQKMKAQHNFYSGQKTAVNEINFE